MTFEEEGTKVSKRQDSLLCQLDHYGGTHQWGTVPAQLQQR